MNNQLYFYNSIKRKKELFEPLIPPNVGMYVCGPTVYGDAHLGHARPAVSFDLIFRYLLHLGYKVRYVRNITDVGHLENDADTGDDKIAKRARLEQLEPMEVVQYFSDRYHHNMEQLNVLKPSIEPRASGHIIEQIEMIKKIIENGFAYEVNGSIYFDLEKFNSKYQYGKLSGRILDDMLTYTRELDGQEEKQNSFDFALWKKANPEHIMRWPSPWSEGFPGWHLECSAMSTKYLGDHFDIHGGGMDLLFPHHDCEIAQSVAANGTDPVKYWIHNNMITINGQKMGKSLGNAVTLNEFFKGDHKLLEQSYSPMTIRFFILQAHYRSTLDFSNEALQAAEKGLKRLMKGFETIEKIKTGNQSTVDITALVKKCYEAMNDDFNSPILIAQLFEGIRIIHLINDEKESISQEDLITLKSMLHTFTFDVLGLKAENDNNHNNLIDELIQTLLTLRKEAKEKKDFVTSDHIRDLLTKLKITIKDTKDGFEWELDN